jgi:DUF4097 and DUF4098 domain-containing protein YvlB
MKRSLKNTTLIGLSLAAALVFAGCGKQAGEEADVAATDSANVPAVPTNPARLSKMQEQSSSTPNLSTSIDKGITRLKLGNASGKVFISNDNGMVEIKQGPVKEMEIGMTVDVPNATAEEAKAVAGKTELAVKDGESLRIETRTVPYGKSDRQYPSIQLAITLPEGAEPDLQVELKNGNMLADDVKGPLSLQTLNGNVEVNHAKRNVQIRVMNGNIQVDHVGGPLDIRTANGNLFAKNAGSSVRASTSAGNIRIDSDAVGGDWEVSTVTGKADLSWPAKASTEVEGSTTFGVIRTDLPLTVTDNQATGKMGNGKYRIHVSGMSGLSLMNNY